MAFPEKKLPESLGQIRLFSLIIIHAYNSEQYFVELIIWFPGQRLWWSNFESPNIHSIQRKWLHFGRYWFFVFLPVS